MAQIAHSQDIRVAAHDADWQDSCVAPLDAHDHDVNRAAQNSHSQDARVAVPETPKSDGFDEGGGGEGEGGWGVGGEGGGGGGVLRGEEELQGRLSDTIASVQVWFLCDVCKL